MPGRRARRLGLTLCRPPPERQHRFIRFSIRSAGRVEIDEDFARPEVAHLKHELLNLLPYFDLRAVDGSGANVERLDHHSFAAE